MTPEQFAEKIRTKYPGAYDNIDDVELSQRVIEKYPVYADQVNFEVQPEQTEEEQGFVSRTKEIFGEEVKRAERPEVFEKDTSILRRIAGAATLPLRSVAAGARAVGRTIAEPIGKGIEKSADVLSDIPAVQRIAQTETSGNVLEAVGKLGQGASEALEKVRDKVTPEVFRALEDSVEVALFFSGGKVAKESTAPAIKAGLEAAKTAAEAGEQVLKTTVAKASGGARNLVPKDTVNEVAVGQMRRAINLNPSDIRRIQRPNVAGEDPALWLLQREFKGSQDDIMRDLSTYRQKTKSTIDTGLEQIKIRVPANEAKSARGILEELKDTFTGTRGNEKLVEQIDNLIAQNDYSLAELNSIKRLVDENLNIFLRSGEPATGARAQGLRNLRDDLKKQIENTAKENGFDDVQFLNKETQISREIETSIGKRQDVSKKLLEVGPTDALFGIGGFAVSGGDFVTAAGIVITKKLLQSSRFRTFVANKISKLPANEKALLIRNSEQGNVESLLEFLAKQVDEYQKSNPQP